MELAYLAWWIILLIIVFSRKTRLDERMRRIEEKVEEQRKLMLRRAGKSEWQVHAESIQIPVFSEAQQESIATPENVDRPLDRKKEVERKTSRFLENRPMKLWWLIFFLWIVRWVTYAFMNNWIPPRARIWSGIWLWWILMLLWYIRLPKNKDQWSVLLWLGSAVILVVLYLWRLYYNFFSPSGVLLASLALVIIQGFIAVKKDLPMYARYSLLLSLLAPLITHSSTTSFAGLFGYLAIIYVWTLGVVTKKWWSSLAGIWLASYIIYSFPFLAGIEKAVDPSVALMIVSGIFLIFMGTSLWDIQQQKERISPVSLWVVTIAAVFHLFWIDKIVPEEYLLFYLLVIAAGFAYLAWYFLTQREPSQQWAFITYSALAILYLFMATYYELSGVNLAIAYILEIVLFAVLLLYWAKKPKWSMRVSSLLLMPTLMYFAQGMIDTLFLSTSWSKEHLTLLLLTVSALWLAYLYQRYATDKEEWSESISSGYITTWLVFGWVAGLWLIWMLFQNNASNGLFIRGFVTAIFLAGLIRWVEELFEKRFSREKAMLWVTIMPMIFYYLPAIISWMTITNLWMSIAVLFVFVVLFGATWAIKYAKWKKEIARGWYIVAVLIFLWLVRFGAEAYRENKNTAHMFSLVVFTLLWIVGYIWGANSKLKYLKRWSWIVILWVILRLLIIDVRMMWMWRRIITFLVIWCLLLGSAYFLKSGREEKDL